MEDTWNVFVFWLFVRIVQDSLVAMCWERAVLLAFRLCRVILYAFLIMFVPFPFGA